MKLFLRTVTPFLGTIAISTALAVSAPAALAATHGSHPVNPYLPSNGHAYRHGAVPTVSDEGRIRAWDAQQAATSTVATGPKTLYFGGGSSTDGVAHNPKVYLVFYGSQWGTEGMDAAGNATFSGDSSNGAPLVQKMFKGLGTNGETWSGTMTQYCDGSSVVTGSSTCPAGAPHAGYPGAAHYGGVWYDNVTAPAAATNTDLANAAVAAANYFGNTTPASNRDALYVVLSAHNANPDNFLTGNYCAWHSATTDATAGNVAYVNMPYLMDRGQPCGAGFVNGTSGPLDGYTMVAGHEYAEWLTDMYPNTGWVSAPDVNGNIWENADECIWIQPGLPGGSGDVALATGNFAMQSTWSNDTNECDLSHPVQGSQPGSTVTVSNPGNQSVRIGALASVQIRATDSAPGALLTYAASGLPAGLSINPSTGLLSGTPLAVGTSNVTVSVTDGAGGGGTATFSWSVIPLINVVTVVNPGAQSILMRDVVQLQVVAVDTDLGATLSYRATNLPAGLTINAATGLISGIARQQATSTVTVQVTDSTGVSAAVTFSMAVVNKQTAKRLGIL